MNKIYLGLTGRMGSGKGEVVKILQGENFRYISLSDIVREEARKTGRSVTRAEMQNIGNRLRQMDGPGALAKRIRQKISQSPQTRWIIDGIRNPAEILELKQLKSFVLLAVQSPLDDILQRLKNRQRDTDRADVDELKRRLDREWGQGEPGHGQQVKQCMDMADYQIDNSKTLQHLKQEVLRILKKMGVNHES